MPYALSKYADVKFYGPGFEGCTTNNEIRAGKKIDVLKVIENLYPNDYPDVVMQGDPHMNGLFHALKNFQYAKCLRVIWLIDFHNATGSPNVFNYMDKMNVDVILKTVDLKNITEWGEKLRDRLEKTGVKELAYPFSYDPEIFYDMKLEKKYDITNIGVMNPSNYPLRYKIHTFFGDGTFERRHKKSNQMNLTRDDLKYHWSNYRGKEYAEDINKSRIFITGCSSYNFPLQKFFEVMGCNTLLLCNTPIDAEELGFKPGVNFAEIKCAWKPPKRGIYMTVENVNEEEFVEPIKYYLSYPDEAAEIAKRGHDLVHSRHTHEIRARETINKISKHL